MFFIKFTGFKSKQQYKERRKGGGGGMTKLVNWCFEPTQSQGIISGLRMTKSHNQVK